MRDVIDSAQPRSDGHAQRAIGGVFSLAALTCWLLGRRKLRSYFSRFVDQSSPDYVSVRGRDRSLQCRFPIVDILFCSGDIRDRSAKSSEIAPKSMFFGPKSFWGDPQILDLVFKTAFISDHVPKFRSDRPRDRGDFVANKKRKKQQQNTQGPRLRYRNGRP